MAKQRTMLLHTSPDREATAVALWPEHKPLAEVRALEAVTPPLIWSGTYQGMPTPPGGYTYKRVWWGKTRYQMASQRVAPPSVIYARYQSWDTAYRDTDTAAYTAMVQGDLMRDYRLRITMAYRARLEFDSLPQEIQARADAANWDGKLRAVIIEDKGSGISALQTLRAQAPEWLAKVLVPYQPTVDKEMRGSQASVWCKNGSVWLPHPDKDVLWLPDLEDELFTFPQSTYKDYADAFSQLVIYCENLLAAGYQARDAAGDEYRGVG